MDNLITVADIAVWLNVSPKTIYNWRINEGFPEPVRIGKRAIRWTRESVSAWLATR